MISTSLNVAHSHSSSSLFPIYIFLLVCCSVERIDITQLAILKQANRNSARIFRTPPPNPQDNKLFCNVMSTPPFNATHTCLKPPFSRLPQPPCASPFNHRFGNRQGCIDIYGRHRRATDAILQSGPLLGIRISRI